MWNTSFHFSVSALNHTYETKDRRGFNTQLLIPWFPLPDAVKCSRVRSDGLERGDPQSHDNPGVQLVRRQYVWRHGVPERQEAKRSDQRVDESAE